VLAAGFAAVCAWGAVRADDAMTLESANVLFRVSQQNGAFTFTDKRSGVVWASSPRQPHLGSATIDAGRGERTVALDHFGAPAMQGRALSFSQVLPEADGAVLTVRFELLPDDETLQISAACNTPCLRRVRLLEDALWIADVDGGGVLIPIRLGLFIPSDNGKVFRHEFRTSEYEGCHAEMVGLFKAGSAALLSWHDADSVFHLQSVTNACPVPGAKQVLLSGMDLSPRATALRIRLLGKASYGDVARAYREEARTKGYLVTWADKLPGLPRREALFGASNVKLWTCMNRRMNEESTAEESVRVEWTFDQAAQVAEHLKNDVGIDRVLFILGGWTAGGYDCRHPDIMPASPECGGNAGLAACARRVEKLGYTFGLHDNYQDMYRDAPSWGESWLMRDRAGNVRKGGRWLGGRAYLTCSPKALELARRPQNLPEVARVIAPGAYFIDTTFAVGLQECFATNHPLTRADDLHWKAELSKYARSQFGIFGSECGREWAIPCADFFEGLSGVSGELYHHPEIMSELGATQVPIFEMIYHDCIQIYGKYGYRPEKATAYVLNHLLVGRPLNYHQFPPGLYWRKAADEEAFHARPSVATFDATGARTFRISYRWKVEKALPGEWHALVHFTDAKGKILFQSDYAPKPPAAQWQAGEVVAGPFEVTVPSQVKPGAVDIRVGLFKTKEDVRAKLDGADDGEHRCVVGRLQIAPDGLTFEEPAAAPQNASEGFFVRADNGWAEGLCPLDRFIKNTHEVLSPLNRLTAQMPLSEYAWLTPDRTVRRSVFGDGSISAVANLGTADYTLHTMRWGDVVLPADGFFAEAPGFLAFAAKRFNGRDYAQPVLFTLQSLDDRPLECSRRVRVYHGFGDSALVWKGKAEDVKRETILNSNWFREVFK
jgi:hypothetical protein